MQAKNSPFSLKTMLNSYTNGEEHLQVTAKISRDICLNAQDGAKCLIVQFRKHFQFNTSWGKEQKLHFYPSKCCLFKNFKHVDNVLWPYLHFQVPHFKPSQVLLHAPLPTSYLLFDNPLSAALLKWVQRCPSDHGQPAGPYTCRNLTLPPPSGSSASCFSARAGTLRS